MDSEIGVALSVLGVIGGVLAIHRSAERTQRRKHNSKLRVYRRRIEAAERRDRERRAAGDDET